MIDPLELFYSKKVSPENFKFDQLRAKPLFSMIPIQLDQYFYHLATSPKYASKINYKYEVMDNTMRQYGFELLARGTNRAVYKSLTDDSILIKVGYDKAGVQDAPKEWRNQQYLKPFVAKTFEISPTGTIALVERCQSITYKDEFKSVAEDIFHLLTTFILGKYILADIGTNFYMNWALRKGFGPVLIDYPFMYELDGNKLKCTNYTKLPNGMVVPCDGYIDYDEGFNFLKCEKCGKQYFAQDLGKYNETTGKFELINPSMEVRTMASVKIYKPDGTLFGEFGTDTTPVEQVDCVHDVQLKPRVTGYSNPPERVVRTDNHIDFIRRKIKKVFSIFYFEHQVKDRECLDILVAGLLTFLNETDKGYQTEFPAERSRELCDEFLNEFKEAHKRKLEAQAKAREDAKAEAKATVTKDVKVDVGDVIKECETAEPVKSPGESLDDSILKAAMSMNPENVQKYGADVYKQAFELVNKAMGTNNPFQPTSEDIMKAQVASKSDNSDIGAAARTDILNSKDISSVEDASPDAVDASQEADNEMLKEVNDSKSDEIMDAVTEATTLNQNANNKAFNESLNAINSRTVVVKTDQPTPPKRPIKLPGNKGIDMF
jgi:hypothetical protein